MLSFREKSAAACIVILTVGFAAYGLWAWRASVALSGAVALLDGAVIVQIIAQVVAHTLFSLKGAPEPADERDQLIDRLSQRNAYWVLFSALWGVIGLVTLSAPALAVFYSLVGLAVVAEVVRYGSRLIYYQRGV